MIFISIASYCDNLLFSTMVDALDNAKYKNDLVFGVVEQTPPEFRIRPSNKSIRYIGVNPQESRGACWARALCMSLYEGEEFYFQIDSHMMFDDAWDEKLINTLSKCPSEKSILSSYPNAFVIENGVRIKSPVGNGSLCHVVRGDFQENDMSLGFEAQAVDADCVPGFSVGAGCLFAGGAFVEEIPYDARLYFHGEEQSIALRAYTNGWDIFHAPLPIYHWYDTDPDNAYRPKHWDQTQDSFRFKRWWEINEHAQQRLKNLIEGKVRGAYGLGTKRTLEQFIEFSGIDYKTKTVNDIARKPKI